MDFTLTEEQTELQGLAKQILGDRMTLTHLRELDNSEDWFDRETWAEFAKANLLGVALPEDIGGLGYGFLELCLILAGAGPHGRAAAVDPHARLRRAAHRRVRHAGAAQGARPRRQRRQVVSRRRVQRARHPGATSRRRSPRARATAGGSPARRSTCRRRTSRPASSCRHASARTSASSSSWPKADGITLERQETMNHEPQFVVKLDGRRGSTTARIGEIADGRENLRWILDRTMTRHLRDHRGCGQEALRITAEYTTTRKQFDRAIGTFQAVGQRMADSYIDTEAINLTMLQAATHLAAGPGVTDRGRDREVLGGRGRQPGRCTPRCTSTAASASTSTTRSTATSSG